MDFWCDHASQRLATSEQESCALKRYPSANETDRERLPADFVPGNYHVICGRDTLHSTHIGNRRFKVVMSNYLDRYLAASTNKPAKSKIVSEIVEPFQHSSSSGGGFVRYTQEGYWYSLGDCMAREKVGQEMRNALRDLYKSSNENRPKQRKTRRSETNFSTSPTKKEPAGELLSGVMTLEEFGIMTLDELDLSNPQISGYDGSNHPLHF